MMSKQLAFTCCLAFLLGGHGAVAQQDQRQLVVLIDGSVLPASRVVSVVVESDGINPDSASVLITRPVEPLATGRGLDIAHVDGQILFQGEILEIRALDQSRETGLQIRALNRLHRLSGTPHTRTFDGQSDADIARRLAADAGLRFGPTGAEALVVQERVSQENQTDLAFLRERAASLGYELSADDTTLHFTHPLLFDVPSLGCDVFHPRLGSANGVSEVVVRGWDPIKKVEVVGRERQQVIPLSETAARSVLPVSTLDLGLVPALDTPAASHGAAVGTLAALTAGGVSAEAAVEGLPSLKAGVAVTVQGAGDRFDGTYFVQGTSHRYTPSSNPRWRTLLRLVREDRAVYFLPEIGDEVLVAFEHGDLSAPIVVGSLWDDSEPSGPSTCRGRRRD